jgi:PAS domain S-box-containing protein
MRRGILPILLAISLNVEGAEPRRVLLIHSFGQEFQPFITFSADFRSGLARKSHQPVDFFDVALAGARFESGEEGAFVDYLGGLFTGHRLDLVVPMGAPAVGFAQKYRARLFPETPMLLTSVDQRMVQSTLLTTNDAVIAVRHDPRRLVEAILQLMPGTTNVVMVFGNSPLERFWADAFMRESQLPTNHVGCESFSGLSFEQMKQRAAALPRGSVMLFGDVLIDADGIPQTGDEALVNLHAAANVPIFGIHDFQLGHGIVGGPLIPVHELAHQSASAAARILEGESPASFRPPPMEVSVPTYDWRELQRWNISENRLPEGSVVKYRQSTIWQRRGPLILSAALVLLLQAIWIVGLVLNLRRRRRAERLLRENKERMKLAAAAAKLGMWEWDLTSNKVWVETRFLEKIAPEQRGESDFSRFMRTVHPEDRDGVAQAVAKAINEDGNYDHQHRQVDPDGRIRWISARARVEFNAEHKPVKMRGVGMDITDRKLAEEQARETERQFLLIANATPVMIWTSGPDKLCTFINQAWLEFRGRPEEQELGNGWADGIHPEDLDDALKIYMESFDARQPFTMEYRLRRRDGQYRWILDHGVPRYDTQKSFLGYIGSCLDVTDRKEAEAAAQRSQQELAHLSRVSTLGELAGSLAHELNQPLGAILSNAEAAEALIAGNGHGQEAREALKAIIEQAARAREIIKGMRGMLKKDPEQMTRQDLNRIVKEVLAMVRSDLVFREVRSVMRLDAKLPAVNGHGVQLRQVLLNLVMNACDAMSQGPKDRRLMVIETRFVTPNEVEVSVCDTGPGFTEEMLQHAFEPFRTTKAHGLGLGLAICRSIINTHHGRFMVANNSGRGATLRFTLPAQNQTGL